MTSTREARDVTMEDDALDWRCARDARALADAERCRALAARVEELGRRHTAAAKALADTRARVEELVEDARRARARGEVAAKACEANGKGKQAAPGSRSNLPQVPTAVVLRPS